MSRSSFTGILDFLFTFFKRYFVSDIAERRNMTFDEVVESSGNGTVILGKQAYEEGLVDFLGDLDTAIEVASLLADIEYPETAVFERTSSITDIFSWLYSGVSSERMVLKT